MSVVNSRPYAWPYHGSIRPAQTGLVISVDSLLSLDESTPALGRLVVLRDYAARLGIRIVHLPKAGYVPLLPPSGDDLVVYRPAYGAFTGGDLDLVLRGAGLSDLLIAGFPFELGADCTMREANDLGYECLLVEDCCTGMSDQTLAGAISSVQMSGGIFGAVATFAEVIEGLERIQASR